MKLSFNKISVRLHELKERQKAVVTGFDDALANDRRARFEELGIIQDTAITRERRAPLGDPIAFRVRGSLLCLRQAEAKLIKIKLIDE